MIWRKKQKDIIEWINNENKDYGIQEAFVLSNANISVKDKIVYYPIYMIMFIDEALIETPIIKKLDLSDI